MLYIITCTCGNRMEVTRDPRGHQGRCSKCLRSFVGDDSNVQCIPEGPVLHQNCQEQSRSRTDKEEPSLEAVSDTHPKETSSIAEQPPEAVRAEEDAKLGDHTAAPSQGDGLTGTVVALTKKRMYSLVVANGLAFLVAWTIGDFFGSFWPVGPAVYLVILYPAFFFLFGLGTWSTRQALGEHTAWAAEDERRHIIRERMGVTTGYDERSDANRYLGHAAGVVGGIGVRGYMAGGALLKWLRAQPVPEQAATHRKIGTILLFAPIVLLLPSLVTAMQNKQTGRRAHEWRQTGDRIIALYEDGEYPTCIEECTAIIEGGECPSEYVWHYYSRRALSRHRLGEYQGALDDYPVAVAKCPTVNDDLRGSMHLCMAECSAKLDRPAEAIAACTEIIDDLPNTALDYRISAYAQRAPLHRKLGDREAAVRDYTQAIDLTEKNFRREVETLNLPAVYRKFAWLLATAPEDRLRNGPRAIELAQRSLRLYKGDHQARYLEALAAAQAESGQVDQAVQTQQKALDGYTDEEARAACSKRLEAYMQGNAWREN